MTDTVLIYGANDDLIEIEGAVEDEIQAFYDDVTEIEFSDGRRFRLKYTSDGWLVWCMNEDEDLQPVDLSDVDYLGAQQLPNVTNDYSEVAVYKSWPGLDFVERVDGSPERGRDA